MNEKSVQSLIFTDLDRTFLHRDTFKFDEIKTLIQLISKGILSSQLQAKRKEIEFNNELGSDIYFRKWSYY